MTSISPHTTPLSRHGPLVLLAPGRKLNSASMTPFAGTTLPSSMLPTSLRKRMYLLLAVDTHLKQVEEFQQHRGGRSFSVTRATWMKKKKVLRLAHTHSALLSTRENLRFLPPANSRTR